jgi:biopolymer transport protein ExbD
MASKKPKRGSPALDMTAMVDVAFLLLTFFILTTTRFREDQAVQVQTPSSVSETLMPKEGAMTILVSDSGRVYLGIADINMRQAVLEKAIADKRLGEGITALDQKEMNFFMGLESFGVPFNQMKRWLDMSNEERKAFKQPGISAVESDTVAHVGNELKDWIRYARISDPKMRFIIKGDGNAPYSAFEKVTETLQGWEINQFALVTSLEGKVGLPAKTPAKKP